jgi:2-C-methyl-D-erythritol 4-phosphate cytidylyltransferase
VFLPVFGQPLILITLKRFVNAKSVGRVIVVIAEKEMVKCEALIRGDSGLEKLNYTLQPGGSRRQDSVKEGLSRLDEDCEVVVIHDGARPFVSPGLIDRCVDTARSHGAAVAGVPARDTIKIVSKDGIVERTLDRGSIWQIQTPQAFRAELIRAAHELSERENTEATDDAMLVERLGARVVVVEGDPWNIKVTVPADLVLAESLFQKWAPS